MDAKQFRTWRTIQGLSQEAAAKLLGCSTKSIGRYEKSGPPEAIAAATLAMGKTADAGVELVPPYDKANRAWDNPWDSPRWWQRAPGKKIRWDRIPAGQPMRAAGATMDKEPPAGYKPAGDPRDHGYEEDDE
jgi:transcriptional regulator with XRE-family HTH domain